MCFMARLFAIAFCLLALDAGVAEAGNPIRIGLSASLSGRYSAMGGLYAQGLRLWEKDINAQGGLLGRPVEILIKDDQSSPERAHDIYERMLSRGEVDLVLGPYSSAIGRAIAPVVEDHRCPTLFPLSAADSVWNGAPRYAFGMNTSERRWISAIFAFLARHGIEKVGILVNKRLFAMGVPNGAEKWALRLDLKILVKEALNQQNVEKQLLRAKDLGVQAVIHWGYMADAVLLRRTLNELNWYPKLFVSQIAPALDEYHRILGPLANYSVGASVWEPCIASCYPGGTQFVEAFQREYDAIPTYQAAAGFAAGEVLAAAINEARSIDREKVRKELGVLDTVTIIGRYGVDAKGRQLRQRPLIIQWQDGVKKVLWPKDVSNGKLQFPTEQEP